MKSPKAPAPPDPVATAQAQSQMNADTARLQAELNRANQYGPWGSVEYTNPGKAWMDQQVQEQMARMRADPTGSGLEQNPWLPAGTYEWDAIERQLRDNLASQNPYGSTDQWTQTVTLSPEQQRLYDQSMQAQGELGRIANAQLGRIGETLSQPLDFSGLPGLRSDLNLESVNLLDSYAGADDFSADRQRVEEAIMSRLDPGLRQDESRLRNRLINAGIRPGTAAWDSEYARLSRAENDARTGAILAGGQEQSRLVGLARDAAMFTNESRLAGTGFNNQAQLSGANQQNAARAQALQELLAQRAQPINEISALLSGGQVTNPAAQFSQMPGVNVGGVDYAGLVGQNYQGQVAASNAAAQQQNAMMGGLFGLGGSLLGAAGNAGGFGSLFSGIFSDRRLKENVERVGKTDDGQNIYAYNYKGDDTPQIGLMAQEVEKRNPDAVREHPSGYKMVDYGRALGTTFGRAA